MTQGRLKTSGVRSAKAALRKAAGKRKPARKKVAKPSRKKSAANRAPKVNTSPKVDKAAKRVASSKSSARVSGTRASSKATATEARTEAANPATSPRAGGRRGRARQGAPSKASTADVKPAVGTETKLTGAKQARKLKPSSQRRPVQLGLGFDDQQDALAVLQQQNKRLMLKIAQRRASLALLRQLSEELMQEASQRVLPYREELKALTRELLDLESRVVGADRLAERDRARVRLVFHELLKDLPQDELEAEHEALVGSEPSPSPKPQEDSGTVHAAVDEDQVHVRASTGPDTTASSVNEPDPSIGVTSEQSAPRTSKSQPQSEAAQPEARSADKPAGDQSGALRSLFKRLVIQWHPDRVRDDVQKAERTRLMKEFTQAFEGGDLAKLVALEQTLALKSAAPQAAPDTKEKRAEQLRRANAELLTQLGELQANLEAVRDDCPFTLDYRKKDPASGARDELDEFVLMNHLAVQRATETRDFVLNFARGKMKLVEFLRGPRRSN